MIRKFVTIIFNCVITLYSFFVLNSQEQSLGKKPTYYKLFIRNHTKRSDGTFVNEKDKALNVSILIKI